MVRSRSDYAKFNVISGLAIRGVTIFFSFIIRYVITHSLGMEYLGVTSYITSILNTINITELGIGTAITFALYKPIAENDEEQICAILRLYQRLYRICGFIFLGIGICLLPFIRNFISGDVPAELNIYIIYLLSLINATIPYLMFEYRRVLFDASQHSYIPNIYYLISSVLLSISQIASIVWLKDFYLYTGLTILCSVATSLCALILTKRRYPRIRSKGFVKSNIIKQLKTQVSGLFITKIVTVSRNTFDNLIITNLSGLVSTAIYGSYFQIVNSLTLVMTIVTSGLTSSIGNSIITETKAKNLLYFKKLNFMFMTIVSWATVCMYFLYQPFIKGFYGPAMLTDEWTKNVFCIYFFLISSTLTRDLFMDACGLWNERKTPAIFEALVKVILSFVLGRMIGIVGMLIGTIIAFLLCNLLWVTPKLKNAYFNESSDLRFIYGQILQFGVITLITIALITLLTTWLHWHTLISLLVACAVVVPLCLLVCLFKDPLFSISVEWVKMILHIRQVH